MLQLFKRGLKTRAVEEVEDEEKLELEATEIMRDDDRSLTGQAPLLFMPPPFEEWWRGVKCYPCLSVRPLSKFGVRSITFERLNRFNSNLVC